MLPLVRPYQTRSEKYPKDEQLAEEYLTMIAGGAGAWPVHRAMEALRAQDATACPTSRSQRMA